MDNSLTELATRKNEIVLLAAGKHPFSNFVQKFPTRFFSSGGSEQHLLSFAAGLAYEGKIPVISISSSHLNSLRDQLKLICNNKLPVKIIGRPSESEDLAFLHSLNDLTVMFPADESETQSAILAAGITPLPVYIHSNSIPSSQVTPVVIGRSEILRTGQDCTLLVTGSAVKQAIVAAEKLAKEGIDCTVIYNHTIQPFDRHALLSSVNISHCVITIGHQPNELQEILSSLDLILRKSNPLHSDIIYTVKNALIHKCKTLVKHNDKHFTKAPLGKEFQLHNGQSMSSIIDLNKVLLQIPLVEFSTYCNLNKNDFATWVNDVFQQKQLSVQLNSQKTPIGMALVINRWFNETL